METAPDRGNAVIVLAFGLPVMTTAIVVGSMYVGHVITNRSDRPAQIVRVESATPKIDVNVPQAAPPSVQIATQAPRVDVHVPVGPAPTVTVNTPPPLAPNITVNPPPASVTIIDRHDEKQTPAGPFVPPEMPKSATPNLSPKVDPAATAVSTPADAVVTQPESTKQTPAAPATIPAAPAPKIDTPVKAKAADAVPAEPTLDNLYQCATRYIDLYCTKHGLDPLAETRRWNKTWQSSVEQSIADNIDSGEQSYINRTVIAKRDCFNLATATPDKIVEACRILLRYRDGQLAWLQAMKDALTNENLRKSITLLAAGP